MVDVASMLMLMSFFGSEFAVIYVVVGLLLAIGGGLLLNAMKMENTSGVMIILSGSFIVSQSILISVSALAMPAMIRGLL